MKKMVFAIALIALAFGGSAFAQVGSWQDNMGIYFDAEGTIAENNDGVPGLLNCFIVLTGVTQPTVDGFECKIVGEGGLLVSYDSVAFPVDAIDVGSRFGEIIVGFGEPLPVEGGKAVVATFDIIVTNPTIPGAVYLSPVYFPSLPGVPAYLAGGELVPARNSTEDGMPVLVTNSAEGVVDTDEMSFDNLKSLYR
jgi:hypothetical protein